jgi:hypothetical protein
MRSEGEPMLGHGRIFDIADDFVLCDSFEIEDHWKEVAGLDIGGMGSNSHPQAIVKLAYDVESDTIYVTNSWKQVGVSANDAWGATQKWMAGVPLAWPHDGLQQEKGRDDSIQIKNHYKNAGFNVMHEHAQWPGIIDKDGKQAKGGISVEAGVYDYIDRARKGKLKIFRGQPELMDEWRQYHRDDKGNIVKIKDDLLSAARYGSMMLRFAKYVGESQLKQQKEYYRPQPISVIGRR